MQRKKLAGNGGHSSFLFAGVSLVTFAPLPRTSHYGAEVLYQPAAHHAGWQNGFTFTMTF